ncbi:hypothetical protein AMATHDRAFT_149026 [Amanita thiersii Skay4041]|uniref:mRNA export factor GLE1 n=1 Tax=Amanita thiersii Skay4041 TaxID=703135 RepID=A0A2A9NHM2_9AGAR|nr:hypothetical protein AMATHDRAFT_149026 [Amanita thiersii Skay4041]
MRFGVPRSLSPSPVRGKQRRRSTYGLYSESESDSDNYDLVDSESADSDSDSGSENSYLRVSELSTTRSAKRPSRRSVTDAELRHIEDTVATIRLRTRHHDPYEEWEQQTRKDAFRTARKTLTESESQWHDEQDRARAQEREQQDVLHAQQIAEVQNHLNALRLQRQSEEQKLREAWKARDRMLWERIEGVIKLEEDKFKRKLEEEKRIKAEEEQRRRLEEERRKMEAERKKKEEEEARRKKEQQEREEAEAKQRQEEEERTRLERLKTEKDQRQIMGLSTADEDWQNTRAMLHKLKNECIKVVKANKALKSEWNSLRRQITPKIGQLTNDSEAIRRITTQLVQICAPPNAPPRDPRLYATLLSSLAKAILMQAETEVTAEPRTADPLSQVTFGLIESLVGFADIFYAKLVQRIGGWAIPIVVPPQDFDGRRWGSDDERRKVMGYRKSANGEDIESTSEYCSRVAGIMRVYFSVLKVKPLTKPLGPMFQSLRYWVWFARIVGGQYRSLLESPVAPFLIHTALDVMGTDARDMWGLQWIKMLGLVYQGVTEGFGTNGANEPLYIGGQTPEGKSSRMRVQLEIERIMSTTRLKPATLFS